MKRTSLGWERMWASEGGRWAEGAVYQSWYGACVVWGSRFRRYALMVGKKARLGVRVGTAGNHPPEATDLNTQAYLASHRYRHETQQRAALFNSCVPGAPFTPQPSSDAPQPTLGSCLCLLPPLSQDSGDLCSVVGTFWACGQTHSSGCHSLFPLSLDFLIYETGVAFAASLGQR